MAVVVVGSCSSPNPLGSTFQRTQNPTSSPLPPRSKPLSPVQGPPGRLPISALLSTSLLPAATALH